MINVNKSSLNSKRSPYLTLLVMGGGLIALDFLVISCAIMQKPPEALNQQDTSNSKFETNAAPHIEDKSNGIPLRVVSGNVTTVVKTPKITP